MKNLKTQLFCDRFLQGTLIALALVFFVEMAIFAAVRSLLFFCPAAAFVVASIIYTCAETRCQSYLRQIRVLKEIELCKQVPFNPTPVPPRHRNIRYVQRYVQKGKYAK